MILRVTWQDERLILNISEPGGAASISPEFIREIWSPDIYFYGGRDYKTLHLFRDAAMLRLYADKKIYYSLL